MIGVTSGFLLAAAAGYWVLERAENHKRGLRRVGRWLGGAIIAVAVVGTTCRIVHRLTTGSYPAQPPSSRAQTMPRAPLASSQALP